MASSDPTKKLIHDLNVDILGKLTKVVVKDNTFQEKRTDESKPLRKKDVVAGIVNEIEKIGVKRLSDSLKVVDSQTICETLNIDFKVLLSSPPLSLILETNAMCYRIAARTARV